MQTKSNNTPWRGKELKRFWAIIHKAGLRSDDVYHIIENRFKKKRLHELTRHEFLNLMSDIVLKAGFSSKRDELDRHFEGTPMEGPWRYIRFLQRRLGWDDVHLARYVSWHGRKVGTNIDHLKWLTVSKSRSIITGMKNILGGE